MVYLCAPIVRWCNGSTAVFGTACQGSSPCRTTSQEIDEGAKCPLFLYMILKEDIEKLADEFLYGTDMFIVKLNVGSDNKITIYIDGDNGVTIDDCVGLSRFIENEYDRETEDFELNVSSAGIDQPFINLRQYLKNIERPV